MNGSARVSWTRPPGGQQAEAEAAAPLLDRPWVRSLAWLVAVAFGLVVVFRMTLPRPIPLGVLLLGLVIGSINELVAIGLILIYRGNRIINFAGALWQRRGIAPCLGASGVNLVYCPDLA